MIKTIEIIGAPGTGKSTLTKAMLGIRLPQSCAIVCSPKTALLKPRKIFSFALGFMRRNPWFLIYPKMRKILTIPPTGAELSSALQKAAPSWQSFLEHCLSLSHVDRRDPCTRMLGLYWLVRALRDRAYIEQSDQAKVITVLDEPLSYRLSMFDPGDPNFDWVKEYYRRVPIPHGGIVLEARLETVLQRLHLRHENGGKIALRHTDMNPAELENDILWAMQVAEVAAESMIERGVSVLRLSAEDPIVLNRQKAITFMEKIVNLAK